MSDRPARKASLVDVARAVFWSFLGIRKRTEHEADAVRLSLGQVVIAGIVGAVLFVLALIAVVRIVLSQASA
jgi:hypothetical protein